MHARNIAAFSGSGSAAHSALCASSFVKTASSSAFGVSGGTATSAHQAMMISIAHVPGSIHTPRSECIRVCSLLLHRRVCVYRLERARLLCDALLGGTTGFGAGFSGPSAQEAPPMTGNRDEPSVRIMMAATPL